MKNTNDHSEMNRKWADAESYLKDQEDIRQILKSRENNPAFKNQNIFKGL